jgi:sterol desaturase/sphingolipid hydroxylase (fatty acid hydroxylase superfamily)
MRQSSALSADSGGFGRSALDRAGVVVGLLAYVAAVAVAGWWLTSLLPDRLSLALAGHSFTLKNVHHRIVSDGALVFLLLPSALWIELAFVGWERSSIRQLIFRRTSSMNTDLAVFVLGQGHVLDIAGRLLMLGASMISGLWIRDWLSATFGLSINLPAMPMVLEVVAFFFVYSFFDYWTHRLDHTRLFWPLHRYHHSAEEFCVVTSTRQHPAAFTPVFLINIPMAVLGAPAEVMIYVNVITIALGFLIHSRIDSNWGWVGRWIVQSPNHHRLHHKLDMSYKTGHFAMAPIWDHLFGTWYGEADQSLAIGVAEPYRQGLWIVPDMLRDYWHFWSGFVVRRAN